MFFLLLLFFDNVILLSNLVRGGWEGGGEKGRKDIEINPGVVEERGGGGQGNRERQFKWMGDAQSTLGTWGGTFCSYKWGGGGKRDCACISLILFYLNPPLPSYSLPCPSTEEGGGVGGGHNGKERRKKR